MSAYTVTIDGQRIECHPVEYMHGHFKQVPKGWRLVRPDEAITKDDKVGYYSDNKQIPINDIDVGPVGYWGYPDRPGLLREGDIYSKVATPSDLWRLIRRDASSTASPGPQRWKGCMHRREDGAAFCPVCAFSGRRVTE